MDRYLLWVLDEMVPLLGVWGQLLELVEMEARVWEQVVEAIPVCTD